MRAARFGVALALGAVLGAGAGTVMVGRPVVSVREAVDARPEIASRGRYLAEDDPGWNCATAGSGWCGPGPLRRRQ